MLSQKTPPRILRAVTRTVRMIILDGAGNAVDLTLARKVVATVSLDGAGKIGAYTPGITIGGERNNVVSFVWYADMQQRCGRYTFEVIADYGDRNQARVNWHREWGVELVEYNADESGTLPETLELEAYIDLTGSVNMNGVGMSAYEQWLASDYSEEYEKSVDGFMTWMRRPATAAAEAALEVMEQISRRAGDDHTQAGQDHTRAEEDHTRAGDDHTQAGQDHTRAEEDHTAALQINAGLFGIIQEDGELVIIQNAEAGTLESAEIDDDGYINLDFNV